MYFSSETQPFSDRELEELHTECIENNAKSEITGFLLYKKGNFLQVIEGPDPAVDDLCATIQRDGRHKDFIKVEDKSVERREFQEWQMGFQNLDLLANRIIPGYTDFSNPFSYSEFQEHPSHAHQLLLFFARHV